MTCIVHKYGGSSVADVEKLKQIARMIASAKAEADQVAVVVSREYGQESVTGSATARNGHAAEHR